MAMTNYINQIKTSALKIGEAFTPVLKETKFRETGVITPEEFVIAGDYLAYHCPTWSWAGGGARSYLPADKQYLVTKNVPCQQRCSDLDYDETQMKIDDMGQPDDDGWVDTHFNAPRDQGVVDLTQSNTTAADDDDDDDGGEAVDMDTFDFSKMQDEDPQQESSTNTKALENNRVDVRTYDLSITYDKYYQVPRMWLQGYNESRKLLTVDQMYDDFSADHAKKTITMEDHPHIPGPQIASIHPCRHAEVMKRLMDQLAENGKELAVHQYLLVFLKFMQAVIPTIDYDYTRSIEL